MIGLKLALNIINQFKVNNNMEDNLMIIVVAFIVSLIVWAILVRWIFRIDSIVKNQEVIIRTLEETIIQNEKRHNIGLAQLELMASIANEINVSVEDINEVTEKFGIKFNDNSKD